MSSINFWKNAENKRKTPIRMDRSFGASDEARTRYLHLGKVALYQMSYTRNNGYHYNTRRGKVKGFSKKSQSNFCAASCMACSRMASTSAPTMSSPSALTQWTSGISKKPCARALTY